MFEWDDAKAASNETKHSVSFPFAVRGFEDESRLTVMDARSDYGEVRACHVSADRKACLRSRLHPQKFRDSSHFGAKG